MKDKLISRLLISLVMVIAFVCLFITVAGAEAYDPHFGETEYIDDIGVSARDVIY